MATDRPRYTVSVDDEMFKQIEDFRYANRFPTRSDATVELIRRGLESIQREMDLSTPEGLERLRRRIEEETDAQDETQRKPAR